MASTRQSWGLLALALAALLYGCWQTWPRTVDDAYITFRYAQNLVDGAGPVFNPGERVEGCSSPSWMILSAAAIRAGLDPAAFSKVLGTAVSLGMIVLVFFALRRAGVTPRGAALASLLVGSSFVVQIWATAGMETNGYALAFLLGLILLAADELGATVALAASAALGIAALTRPEGLAFWVLGVGIVAWRAATRPTRLRALAAYALPALPLAAFFAWRVSYYGAPFPNTYYVKTGGGVVLWEQGLHGLRLFAENPAHLPWIAAAILATFVGLRRASSRAATAIVGGAVVLHLVWVVSVGDDGLRVHRFQAPILAPMALLVGGIFRAGWERERGTRRLGIATGALAVATALLSVRALHTEVLRSYEDAALVYQEGNERLGRFLRDTVPAGTRIAVAAAGAIPYYSGLPTIDMYGLNDRHIARTPFPRTRGSRLMKWDNAYVLSLRPEIIVPNRGYFRPGDPFAVRAARDPRLLADSPMDRDLFARVAKDGSYALRPLATPDGSVFYVFERTDGAGFTPPVARR